MDYIQNIEIKNFKSIRHQKIDGCKKINVFIGYPNVGKSNILEGLALFSFTQQYNKESFTLESICRLNHLSDLNFDKDVKNEIGIGINSKYELTIRKSKDDSDFELNIISANKRSQLLFQITAFRKINKKFISPSEKVNTNDDVVFKVKYYIFDRNAEYDRIKSSSLSLPNGDNLLDILQGNADLRKEYAELLKEYDLRLNISDDDIAIAKELKDGTYVSFKHNLISDTLRRLFFFKAAIATNDSAILLFEEPEANMFPPYVRKFTSDIIYDKTNQFFIATHSPYVLDAFMEDASDDLAIYFVYYEGGETKVKLMAQEDMEEVKKYGVDLFYNLENYLKDGHVNNA